MKHFSRRDLMKAGAAALAAPAVLRAHDALAGSGSLSIYVWSDYFDRNTLLADFANATGIKVTARTYTSSAELEAKLRADGGKGVDLVFPSIDTGPSYYKDGLLRPIEEQRFRSERIVPALYRKSLALGAADAGRRYMIPFDWGTEGLTWDSTKFDKASGTVSYGDLWLETNPKQSAVRPKSVFQGTALYLDATGELNSNRGLDLYKSEDDSRRVFEGCLKYLLAHKGNVGVFWNTAREARNAFATGGCTIGQTWDATGRRLHRKFDPKWHYGMPKEGGLAWMHAIGVPSGAANIEQAYEFVSFLFQPEIGARFTNTTGYNSCVEGASDFLAADIRSFLDAAYPAATLDNLFWWPTQTAAYLALRDEYAAKLTA